MHTQVESKLMMILEEFTGLRCGNQTEASFAVQMEQLKDAVASGGDCAAAYRSILDAVKANGLKLSWEIAVALVEVGLLMRQCPDCQPETSAPPFG